MSTIYFWWLGTRWHDREHKVEAGPQYRACWQSFERMTADTGANIKGHVVWGSHGDYESRRLGDIPKNFKITSAPVGCEPDPRGLNRWKALAEVAGDGPEDELIGFSDCRDMLFQANPFAFLEDQGLDLLLAGERPRPGAETDQQNLQLSLPPDRRVPSEEWATWQWPCAGAVYGRRNALRWLAREIYQLGQETTAGTDQAILTYLWNERLRGRGDVRCSNWLAEPWCLSGVSAPYIRPEFEQSNDRNDRNEQDDGRWLTPGGLPYVLVHQWDRIPKT